MRIQQTQCRGAFSPPRLTATFMGADALSSYCKHSKDKSFSTLKRQNTSESSLPALLPVNKPFDNDIDRQIYDEEGVRYVCQQKRIETLCLEVLDKE